MDSRLKEKTSKRQKAPNNFFLPPHFRLGPPLQILYSFYLNFSAGKKLMLHVERRYAWVFVFEGGGGGEAAAIKIMGQKNYASFGSGSIYYIEMHN